MESKVSATSVLRSGVEPQHPALFGGCTRRAAPPRAAGCLRRSPVADHVLALRLVEQLAHLGVVALCTGPGLSAAAGWDSLIATAAAVRRRAFASNAPVSILDLLAERQGARRAADGDVRHWPSSAGPRQTPRTFLKVERNAGNSLKPRRLAEGR